MQDVIEQLLASDGVVGSSPALESDIEAVGQLFTAQLPEAVRNLWRRTDGITFTADEGRCLGPSELIELTTHGYFGFSLIERGFMPLVYVGESNYVMLALRSPLSSRLIFVPHDDESRIRYKDFESLLVEVLRLVRQKQFTASYFYDTCGDYPLSGRRSPVDQIAGLELMRSNGLAEEWNFAVQLLDEDNLDQWSTLLETDHFVRRDVTKRMRQLSSPAIRQLLRNDTERFETFAAEIANAARGRNLPVGERQRTVMQIGGAWRELEFFFYRRNVPNAMTRIIDWIEDSMNGNGPRNRPGNILID